MKEQIEILANLQHIEIEKHLIQSKLDAVAAKIGALDAELTESMAKVSCETDQFKALKKQYRELEGDLQSSQAQVKKSQERLRSVKTNKEYQSMLKEIEDLENRNSALEDEMIKCLDQMESAEKSIAFHEEEAKALSAQISSEKESIEQEAEQDRIRLAELDVQWQKVSQQVDADLLNKYFLVKEKGKKNAVAAVVNAVCQGCNLNIPPQMFNDLQRFETLTFCPHCQRIVYWKNSDS